MPSKPPYFRQTYPFSCVPACLRMVLTAYNFEISETELRSRCECDETGTSLSKAINAVIELGFNCDEANLTLEELKEYVLDKLFPIVYLRFSEDAKYFHAVVVYKITKEKIFVLDPKTGERGFDLNSFIEVWSRGLTIIVEKKN